MKVWIFISVSQRRKPKLSECKWWYGSPTQMVGSIIWIKTYISPASAHNGHYQTAHGGCAGALGNSWYLPEDRVWNCPRYNAMDHRQTFQSSQRTEKDMTRALRTGVRRLTELWGRITNRSWEMGYHQPSNPSVLPHNGEEKSRVLPTKILIGENPPLMTHVSREQNSYWIAKIISCFLSSDATGW